MSEERRYGAWAGNPAGNREDPTRCIVEVHERGRSMLFYQCQRPRWVASKKRPELGKAFCKQHRRMIDAGLFVHIPGEKP